MATHTPPRMMGRMTVNYCEITGKVRSIKFWDEESGATIATLTDGTTVKGDADGGGLDLGGEYRFMGRWRDDARYGRQFTFDTYIKDAPADRAGVIRYLMETCNGIGQATATKLWDAYREKTIELLRDDPRRILADGILRPDHVSHVSSELIADQKFQRSRIELFGLFNGRGFGRQAIKCCIEKWGCRAAELIRRNPWLLLLHDIPRAGFKTVDRLYLELGHNPARLKRQMLAGWDALRQGIEGNTWHPLQSFTAAVRGCVGADQADAGRACLLGIRAEWLASRQDETSKLWIAEAQKATNETAIAERIRMLRSARTGAWPLVSPPTASEHQAEQWAKVWASPVALLTGTPGTGKTFLAAAVLKEVLANVGKNAVAVCAPTGKAAVRITEAMQRYSLPLEATTIHRLLKIGRNGHDGKGWGFLHNAENPLPHRYIAVDEVSMLDTDLAASLLLALAPGTHLLLIGDPYQLPPVGHGAPLRDLIAASIPNAELTEIKRNAGTIVSACKEIKEGRRFKTVEKINEDTGENLRLIECPDEDSQIDTLRRIFEKYQHDKNRDPIWDVQVLTPLNEKSRVSREPLNALLQGILNPLGGWNEDKCVGPFRLNDKIICLRNCMLGAMELTPGLPREQVAGYRPALDESWQSYQHFLANGDMGSVVAVDAERRELVCTFTTPTRTVKLPIGKASDTNDGTEAGSAKDFALAYAVTIHKSQGSEWPVVIVMVDEAAGPVACRELIYTAISRAKAVCLLLGKRSVIDRQCGKVSLTKRKTFLKELLCETKDLFHPLS